MEQQLRKAAKTAQRNLHIAAIRVSGTDAAAYLLRTGPYIEAIKVAPGRVQNRFAAIALDYIYSAEEFLPEPDIALSRARKNSHDVAILMVCRVTAPRDKDGLIRSLNSAFLRNLGDDPSDNLMLSRLLNACYHLFGEGPHPVSRKRRAAKFPRARDFEARDVEEALKKLDEAVDEAVLDAMVASDHSVVIQWNWARQALTIPKIPEPGTQPLLLTGPCPGEPRGPQGPPRVPEGAPRGPWRPPRARPWPC